MKEYVVVIDDRGDKKWYLNGLLHREDGPAIEYSEGSKSWYLNDKLHREDGPAMEICFGQNRWYSHGILHREDGPAIERPYGEHSWYLNGVSLSEEAFNRRKNIEELTLEEISKRLGYGVKIIMG